MDNRSIVIIDDEVDICYLLGSVLKKENYQVSYSHTISEGISKVNSTKPALVFLDINLPDGSGLEALTRIRNIHPDIKIIIISAYDTPKERNFALESGAEMFISKPFNHDKILDAVNRVFFNAA